MAGYHVDHDTVRGVAVAELRELAAGRVDLLGQCVGSVLGGYVARAGAVHPTQMRKTVLLAEAGGDPDEVMPAFQRTMTNLGHGGNPSTPPYPPGRERRADPWDQVW